MGSKIKHKDFKHAKTWTESFNKRYIRTGQRKIVNESATVDIGPFHQMTPDFLESSAGVTWNNYIILDQEICVIFYIEHGLSRYDYSEFHI